VLPSGRGAWRSGFPPPPNTCTHAATHTHRSLRRELCRPPPRHTGTLLVRTPTYQAEQHVVILDDAGYSSAHTVLPHAPGRVGVRAGEAQRRAVAVGGSAGGGTHEVCDEVTLRRRRGEPVILVPLVPAIGAAVHAQGAGIRRRHAAPRAGRARRRHSLPLGLPLPFRSLAAPQQLLGAAAPRSPPSRSGTALKPGAHL